MSASMWTVVGDNRAEIERLGRRCGENKRVSLHLENMTFHSKLKSKEH